MAFVFGGFSVFSLELLEEFDSADVLLEFGFYAFGLGKVVEVVGRVHCLE